MYLKITDKNCAAWKAIEDHLAEIESCQQVCREYTKANGGTQYSHSGFLAAGPVSAILADNPPAGWRKDKSEDGWWVHDMRTKAGKDLRKQSKAMPYVRRDAICVVIGYDFEQFLGTAPGGGFIRPYPAVGLRGGVIIIKLHQDARYTPMEGMIEITQSEFNAILQSPIAAEAQ